MLGTQRKRARLAPRPPFLDASLSDQNSIPPAKSACPPSPLFDWANGFPQKSIPPMPPMPPPPGIGGLARLAFGPSGALGLGGTRGPAAGEASWRAARPHLAGSTMPL